MSEQSAMRIQLREPTILLGNRKGSIPARLRGGNMHSRF